MANKHPFWLIITGVICLLAVDVRPAGAIVAGDETGSPPDSPSNPYNHITSSGRLIDNSDTSIPFGGVGSINAQIGVGTGTVLSRWHVLTAGHVLDGASLVPLLTGEGPFPERPIFWHFPAYLEAYDRQKQGTWRSTPWGAVHQGDYKLIEFFEDGHLELYNLRDDIGEQNNLADDLPEKREELHQALVAWRAAVKAPVPTKLNPQYKPGG